MIRVIMLVLVLVLTLASCGINMGQTESTDSSQEYQFEYDDSYSSIANKISELLKCDTMTGASIESEINTTGISVIKDVNIVHDDIYRILEILDSEDNKYYAYISRGYFIEKITKGSIDGEIISYTIQ